MDNDVRDLRNLVKWAREDGVEVIGLSTRAAERIADRIEELTSASPPEHKTYKCQECGMYPVRGPLENFCRVCVPRLG